ncbi:MAG: ATPase, partial [Actinomycetia bacterium]|nr:ATPase [Actinomycetes bacterium]
MPPALAPQPAAVGAVQAAAARIAANIERVIAGKAEAIRLGLTVLLAEGHLLIEDVPGVGKT